jgi:hypothetical protein
VKTVIKVFLDNKSFTILETDPTNSFQRNVRKKINYSKNLSRKEGKWKHYNQNPTAQTIYAKLRVVTPLEIKRLSIWGLLW